MNQEALARTEILMGEEAIKRLNRAKVAVFGVGGVGGFTVEALVRSGIGEIDLFDSDCVSMSNINRQIIATVNTVGRRKVDVMQERILEINPKAIVHTYPVFYLPENSRYYDLRQYDYIVDAIDTITAKLELALQAQNGNVPIISSMGTGNKRNPTMFEVADIYQTSVCPLAKVMRRECKKRGIHKLKVVYSKEPPMTPKNTLQEQCQLQQNMDESQSIILENMTEKEDLSKQNGCKNQSAIPQNMVQKEYRKRAVPGSVSFVPSVAGLILAGEVIKDLAEWN